MSRVKFNVNTEYAYIQNFKVLQSMYYNHDIRANKHGAETLQTDTTNILQTPSHAMESTGLSPLNNLSSASSKTTLNFFNGRSATGTNISLVTNTMHSPGGKPQAPAPPPPQLQSAPVRPLVAPQPAGQSPHPPPARIEPLPVSQPQHLQRQH